MTEHGVVIAGGGPTGMMLAAELTLAGVDTVVVEPRADHQIESSRSRGLHARTLEVLDQRGIVDRFLDEGQALQVQAYAGIPVDISDFPTRHPYGLALLQTHVERILGTWVAELGVRFLRQREVTRCTPDDAGVDVELSDGGSLRAEYLVGCDGGRSVVRKAAGIGFPGTDPTTSWLIAELQMEQTPAFGLRPGGGIGPAEDGLIGVVLMEPDPPRTGEPTLEELRQALMAAEGTDYGAHRPRFLSRFNDTTRQAATYRQGRVLLAGDAAHIHPPQGGQGLNTGVQDAVNLGWKLAQVVKGTSPDRLLDTYHAERHPVGARVQDNTLAQGALRRTDPRTQSLRAATAEWLRMEEPRKQVAGMLSGLDVHYDLGQGHPLLGRRMPDRELQTADGPVRVYSLLHGARPVVIHFGAPGTLPRSSGADRVPLVEAASAGRWELPVLGEVPAPAAVLVRPDGHVAWVGDGTETGLQDALVTWFGTP